MSIRAIRLAKRIGFCFGVKRAVQMAEDALKEKHRKVYSLGPIIHNRQVVDALSKKGLKVVSRLIDAAGGAVIISSHGISPRRSRKIRARGLEIIDTTCPFVSNAQGIAAKLSNDGYAVIIVGDAEHPEVKALVDFVSGEVHVVKNRAQAARLRLKGRKMSVISQTTQDPANFLEVVRSVKKKSPKDLKVVNTICRDAEERQILARGLAKQVDAMLIVGGRDSANTRRLFEVCKAVLGNSHLVENESEVKKIWFRSGGIIGITSGASTPDWVVKRVIDRLKRFHNVA